MGKFLRYDKLKDTWSSCEFGDAADVIEAFKASLASAAAAAAAAARSALIRACSASVSARRRERRSSVLLRSGRACRVPFPDCPLP